MRGRVRARHDVFGVTAEAKLAQTLDVLISGRGRVVRREEHLPACAAKTLQRLLRVGHEHAAAVQHPIHVEDRDGHERRLSVSDQRLRGGCGPGFFFPRLRYVFHALPAVLSGYRRSTYESTRANTSAMIAARMTFQSWKNTRRIQPIRQQPTAGL